MRCGETLASFVCSAHLGIFEQQEEGDRNMTERLTQPKIRVKHSALKRQGDSMYRSHCLMCEDGILAVMRDMKTHRLLSMDRCLFCGQAYEYEDIDELRKKDFIRDIT